MSIVSALRAFGRRAPSEANFMSFDNKRFVALQDEAADNVMDAHMRTRAVDGYGRETLQPVERVNWPQLGALNIGEAHNVGLHPSDITRFQLFRNANPDYYRFSIHHTHPLPSGEAADVSGVPWTHWEPLSPADLMFAARRPFGSVYAHMQTDSGLPGWQGAASTRALQDIMRTNASAGAAFNLATERAANKVGQEVFGTNRLTKDIIQQGYEQRHPDVMALGGLTKQALAEAADEAGLIRLDQVPTDAASLERFRGVIDAASAVALDVFGQSFPSLSRDQKAYVLAIIGAGASAAALLPDPEAA